MTYPWNRSIPFVVSQCASCAALSIWASEDVTDNTVELELVYPHSTSAPQPNPDMPNDIADVYREAAAISDLSPKGAAALLRLCLQMLCNRLTGQKGRIDQNLERLAKNKSNPFPTLLLEMADTIRVIGNEAVHPGSIDLNDSPEIVTQLFGFINHLVANQISLPKSVRALTDSQPDSVKRNILRRQEAKEK